MLVNVSYNDKELIRKIDDSVGRQFSLIDRIKMGGNGSPKLFISGSSPEIAHLLSMDKYTNTCNIELRPNGLILRFRSLLETYGLVIPYFKLTVYKNNATDYSIFSDQHQLNVSSRQKGIHDFFSKIIQRKAEFSNQLKPVSIN
ncbi:MAG: hypothetical protein RIC15_02185 [Vicingaceae bacterium]